MSNEILSTDQLIKKLGITEEEFTIILHLMAADKGMSIEQLHDWMVEEGILVCSA